MRIPRLAYIGFALVLLSLAYWIRHEHYDSEKICKEAGFVDGGYDYSQKTPYCIEKSCPAFEFQGSTCKYDIVWKNDLLEVKP